MLDRLKEELTTQWQASQLLRLGSWGIALILLFYAVLWLDDALSLQQLEWRREAAKVQQLENVQQQSHWGRQVEKLGQQREQLLASAWQADTPGLAEASLRSHFADSAGQSPLGLEVRRVEFSEPVVLADGVSQLRGRLRVTAEDSTVPWAWIGRLEAHEPGVIVDSLRVRVGSRAGVALDIEFRALVKGLGEESS